MTNMKYIDAEKLKVEIDRQEIGYNIDGKHDAEYDTCVKIVRIIDSLQQEQPEVDLGKASRNVYESWMGGTMDDVRRDMVELGKALYAGKEKDK